MTLFVRVLLASACVLGIACNEAPTDIGTGLIPGTDTLYMVSSDSVPLLINAQVFSNREPLVNNALVLLGKSGSSDAQLLLQVTSFPNVGSQTSFRVDTAYLELVGGAYAFGDTSSKQLSLVGYEIQQPYSALVTWDSIYDVQGNSRFYTTASPVVQQQIMIPAVDSTTTLTVDKDMIQRWLARNSDSATRNQVFGMILLAPNATRIQQFRNLSGSSQRLRLRAVIQHNDSTSLDTLLLESVVASIVQTPEPEPTEIITQGARPIATSFTVHLDSLPANALIINAVLTVHMDPEKSILGNLGADEVLQVRFTNTANKNFSLRTLRENNTVTFSNIGPILQEVVKDGKRGTLVLEPDLQNGDRLFKMNRMYYAPFGSPLAPKLSIVYTVPSMLR
jgi:hypothetical protein